MRLHSLATIVIHVSKCEYNLPPISEKIAFKLQLHDHEKEGIGNFLHLTFSRALVVIPDLKLFARLMNQ